MRPIFAILAIFTACLPVSAFGAGLAFNSNFRVIADDQDTADAVLARAELYRQQVAQEWLGGSLPVGQGPTIIGVEVTDREDVGITWPIDAPGRKFHRVWLATSRNRMVGSTLRHEMVHMVLVTQFSAGVLPAFADEAAASFSDDGNRMAWRQETIASFVRSGNWPRLETVLSARSIAANNRTMYSASCSLAEYLLTLGDKPTFLCFAAAGRQSGWDRALQQYYHIDSVRTLETRWHSWVTGNRTAVAQLPSR